MDGVVGWGGGMGGAGAFLACSYMGSFFFAVATSVREFQLLVLVLVAAKRLFVSWFKQGLFT